MPLCECVMRTIWAGSMFDLAVYCVLLSVWVDPSAEHKYYISIPTHIRTHIHV